MTLEEADKSMDGYIDFAAALVASGRAGGYVSGASHTTADTLRPALRIFGPAPGIKTVSSYFVMVSPLKEFGEDGVLFYADCGLFPDPNAEQLAEIAVTTARTARHVYGIEPRVAMLSFSTKGSAEHPIVEKVRKATALAQQMAPEFSDRRRAPGRRGAHSGYRGAQGPRLQHRAAAPTSSSSRTSTRATSATR